MDLLHKLQAADIATLLPQEHRPAAVAACRKDLLQLPGGPELLQLQDTVTHSSKVQQQDVHKPEKTANHTVAAKVPSY